MSEKIYTYTILVVGLMILFGAAFSGTSIGYVLSALGMKSPEDFSGITGSVFYTAIIAALVGIAALGGLQIGIFGTADIKTKFFAVFALATLVFFVGDFVAVMGIINGYEIAWLSFLVFAILAPITVAYLTAILSFIGGAD